LLAVSWNTLFSRQPPASLAPGPDGNVWFTELAPYIGRATPAGAVTEFPIPSTFPLGLPGRQYIATASDSNLWFNGSASLTGTGIGRITPQGVITAFSAGNDGSSLTALTAGTDGNIYFAQDYHDSTQHVYWAIGQLIPGATPTINNVYHAFDPSHPAIPFLAPGPGGTVWYTTTSNVIGLLNGTSVQEFTLPNPNGQPTWLTAGPDGNEWFTETFAPAGGTKIGHITPQGAVTEFTVPQAATSNTTGPDGNLWFTDPAGCRIGVMTPAGVVIKQYRLPYKMDPPHPTNPENIITGPDGALWFISPAVTRMQPVNLTPSQAFVSQAYRDLLVREVDPVGLAGWSAMIDQGTSRAQVVRDIEVSPEYEGVVVQQLYATYLRRGADPGGLAAGEAFLAGGGTRAQLASVLLGSAEYYQSQGGGTNDGFLNALYLDTLNRTIDPASLAAGEQALAAGVGRDQLAFAVLATDEHRTVAVDLMYQSYLSRVPGVGEQQGWVQFLNGNQSDPQLDAAAIAGFVGSDEYFAGV
jgi:virginiamycin B lyase